MELRSECSLVSVVFYWQFESHPCCHMGQSFVPFSCRGVSHCVIIPDLHIRSSVDEHLNCSQLLGLHIIHDTNVVAMPILFAVVSEHVALDFSRLTLGVELLLHTAGI